MPIEIRELIIKTEVEGHEGHANTSTSQKKDNDKDKIVAECVEQVLDILKQKNER